MTRSAFHYDKTTGEIIGTITVTRGGDLILNKKAGLEMFEVANAHSAMGRIHEYEILQGKIKRKAQARIDKEQSDKQDAREQYRMPVYLKSDDELTNEILIEHINKLNTQAGIKNIDLEELKAALTVRRELHRNPDKK